MQPLPRLPVSSAPIVPSSTSSVDKSEMFIVPNLVTPPPLPPRQRLISQESPPSSPHDLIDEKIVTSTPLVANLSKTKAMAASAMTPATMEPIRKKSVKEIDWDEDLPPKNEENEASIGINLSACVSPKVAKSVAKAQCKIFPNFLRFQCL